MNKLIAFIPWNATQQSKRTNRLHTQHHRQRIKLKKPDAKEPLLHDSTYTKLRNRQS